MDLPVDAAVMKHALRLTTSQDVNRQAQRIQRCLTDLRARLYQALYIMATEEMSMAAAREWVYSAIKPFKDWQAEDLIATDLQDFDVKILKISSRQTPYPQVSSQKPSADVYTDDVIKCALRYVDKNYILPTIEDGSIGQVADPTQMYQESARKEAKRVARRIDGYLKQYRYCVGYALNRLRQGTMDLSAIRVYISNATRPLIEVDAEFLIARVNEETNFEQEIKNVLTTHTLDPNSPAYGVDPEVYIAESTRNLKVKLPEITPSMTELARDQIYGIKQSVKQAFILQKKNTELERLALELASLISLDGYTMSPPIKEKTEPVQPQALPPGFIIPRRKFKS